MPVSVALGRPVISRSRAALVRRAVAALAILIFAGACEVAVDLGGLNNEVCPAGEKPCPRVHACVSTDDPAYGCGRPSCDNPCAAANVQTTTCLAGSCSIASCTGTFSDCNHEFSDGCEFDLSNNKQNCNACGNDCTKTAGAHVTDTICCGGQCVIVACEQGFGDCDGVFSNGCEASCTTNCLGSKTCIKATSICGT
jgi:hypothetical protein